LKKKVQAFWRFEIKAIGVVDYAMEVYVRGVEWDTNLLPFCLGAVGCAVVVVSVGSEKEEEERTNVIEKTSKAKDDLKKISFYWHGLLMSIPRATAQDLSITSVPP
jgi:hypothetical protein